MPKVAIQKPIPVQQLSPPTTAVPPQMKPQKPPKTKVNAMAALFGQKRQKSAVANVPTKTPAF